MHGKVRCMFKTGKTGLKVNCVGADSGVWLTARIPTARVCGILAVLGKSLLFLKLELFGTAPIKF